MNEYISLFILLAAVMVAQQYIIASGCACFYFVLNKRANSFEGLGRDSSSFSFFLFFFSSMFICLLITWLFWVLVAARGVLALPCGIRNL